MYIYLSAQVLGKFWTVHLVRACSLKRLSLYMFRNSTQCLLYCCLYCTVCLLHKNLTSSMMLMMYCTTVHECRRRAAWQMRPRLRNTALLYLLYFAFGFHFKRERPDTAWRNLKPLRFSRQMSLFFSRAVAAAAAPFPRPLLLVPRCFDIGGAHVSWQQASRRDRKYGQERWCARADRQRSRGKFFFRSSIIYGTVTARLSFIAL
jgi:hypothetical protein